MDLDYNAIMSRVIRVFSFDLSVFQEVEEDQAAIQQAWAIVVIAAVASTIGSAINSLLTGRGFTGFLLSLILTPIAFIVGYFLWALITYWVGVNLFQAQTDFDEMQRVIGFAQAPRVLGILAIIPCLGDLAAFLAGIYSLILSVMAIKEGLDVEWPQAVITGAIGWAASAILVAIPGIIVSIIVGGAAAALS